MQKQTRHNMIVSLIENEAISRQEVLAQKLATSGFRVTQASVSRDLDELGIVKKHGVYELPKPIVAAMELGLRSLETAGANLIVGKCDSGLASAITVRIDGGQIEEIVGTIAGDDTIFIAVGDSTQRARAMSKIWGLFSK